MASWLPVNIYYDNRLNDTGATLSATSTATGYDPNFVFNWLETNQWLANGTGTQDLTLDLGTDGNNIFVNGDLEILGAGGADVYASITENASTGTLVNETTLVNSGSNALKMIAGIGSELALNISMETAGGGGADVLANYTENASNGVITQDTTPNTGTFNAKLESGLGSELTTNGDMETAGGGGADVLGTWTEVADGGTITQDTAPNSGTYNARIQNTDAQDAHIYQDITVTAGENYELSFYTKNGLGDQFGRYRVTDVTGAETDIITETYTGIGNAVYEQLITQFSAPSGATTVRLYLYGQDTDSGDTSVRYDDVSIKTTDTDVYIYQDITVTAGQTYDFSFYSRADGGSSVGGRYRVYDVTGASDITALTDTGTTGSTYTQTMTSFTAPTGSTSCRVYFYVGDNGVATNNVVYVDDISVKAVDIDVYVYQDITVTADTPYQLNYFTRGDATGVGGRVRVFDNTNVADITAIVSTGISGSTYTQGTNEFDTPSGCISIRVFLYCGDSSQAGTLVYFDDIGVEAGTTGTCDYLTVYGHNLNTAGADILLSYSDDNITYANAFTAETVSADTVYHKEFTAPTASRFWRIRMTNTTVAPYIRIASFGLKTELDYASVGYDPYAQTNNADVVMSDNGFQQGVYNKFIERSLDISFEDVDATLYATFKTFWETHGLKNFFIAWEKGNNPLEVFLVHMAKNFNNPYKDGGVYRDVKLALKGRKE